MDLTLAAIIIMGGWVIAILVAGLVLTLRPGGAAVRFAPAPAGASGSPGRRDEILLGGDAEAFGNYRGRVRGVQLRPDNRQLEEVELTNRLEDGPVPAAAILSADGQVLQLADGWPEPPVDGPATQTATLRGNATVISADGKRLGKLRLVSFDESSRRVTGLVVEGRGTPSRRLLPIDRVTAAGPDRISTTLPAAEWSRLQPFATDWEIRQSVLQRLAADPALQAISRTLAIDVEDQRVRLRGYAMDDAQLQRVAQAVRTVPEVTELDLDLVTDAGLAGAVSDALARDPATSAVRVQVSAHFGTVDIAGEVPDRATARAIDRVVGQIADVQVLHNMVSPGRSAATA
jgi:osmotically-inducible protein OsmY/sporulation protein YlmC with PRC-barrel domain